MRFNHGFFALWHSECFQLFKIPAIEMLTFLIIFLVAVFPMVALFQIRCCSHSHILHPCFHCIVLSSCRKLKDTNLVCCSDQYVMQILVKCVQELAR